VSTAIAQALKVELSPTEEGQLAHRPVEDARAYSLYLQARGEYGQQTQESLERAMRHLDSALSIVGESALLYTSLGQIHFLYGSLMLGARVHHQHLEQAEEFARKALELEADSPAADGLLGFILYDRFETEEGLRRMKRAVNLNPDDVGNLNSAVLTFSMCAKDEEAAEWLEHLLEADPLNAWTRFIAGEHHLFAGRFDQAQAHFRRGYELEPLGPITRTSYAQVLAYSGQVDQALEILNLSKDSISPDMVWDMIGQALRYALMEDGARARQFLTEDLRSDARTDMLYSWLLAECYALLGESDEAVDWLRNAVEGGFLNPRFFSQVDPFFEPLRGMSEFQDLMNHLQKRWAALRV
jgi:tetratricopeptide (TPR) repeat protein